VYGVQGDLATQLHNYCHETKPAATPKSYNIVLGCERGRSIGNTNGENKQKRITPLALGDKQSNL